jgi:hypothetical protein
MKRSALPEIWKMNQGPASRASLVDPKIVSAIVVPSSASFGMIPT